ncbi:MAG: S8 family serine peptidase [Fibrobacterales bacterium]
MENRNTFYFSGFIYAVLIMLLGVQAAWAIKPESKKNNQIAQQSLREHNPFAKGLQNMRALRTVDLKEKSVNNGISGLSITGDSKRGVIKRLNKLLSKHNSKIEVSTVLKDKLGNTHIRLSQLYKGIAVIGSDIIVHINTRNEVYGVAGKLLFDLNISNISKVSLDEAFSKSKLELNILSAQHKKDKSRLVIFNGRLAIEVEVDNGVVGDQEKWRCFIDAETGETLFRVNQIMHGAPVGGAEAPVQGTRLADEDGSVVSINGWFDDSGKHFLRNNDDLWGIYDTDRSDWSQQTSNDWGASDPSAISLANNMEIVQEYVTNVLGWNSFNNNGIFATANVHEGSNYVNAYWNGSAFYFGDGDGSVANALTVLDITGHEYGHAITDYSSDLIYSYESGALNESFSDILGTLIEFYGQQDGRSSYPAGVDGQADWLCGEDAWLRDEALRDLRDPQRYEQPSYYLGTHWYAGSGDNGGVHYNSGVQNYVFYLLAEGGVGSNDGFPYDIAGIGIEASGEIAMYANMYLLTSSSQYRDSRDAWILAATTLGYDASVVVDVWAAAGIPPLVKNLDVLSNNLNFGGVAVGGSKSMTLTLINGGGEATTVHDLAFDNLHFTANITLPFMVSGGSSVEVEVICTPTDFVSESGTLTISSDAVDNPGIIVTLSAVGTVGAEISVVPGQFDEVIFVGDLETRSIAITNSGGTDLEFTLNFIDNTTIQGLSNESYSFEHYLELDKERVDTRIGRPILASSGGPDTFGYSWKDSDETGGPTYTWTSISTTGSVLSSVSRCDDCFEEQALSFDFPFYEDDFNSVFVSSNGYLTFGTGTASIGNYPLPSALAPANLIDLFHDDLDPGDGGTIYFQDFGTHAIVEFNAVYPYSGTGSYTFQAVIHASGKIAIYYNSLVGTLTGNTVGIQNGNRDDGLTVAYNTSYLKNQLAVEFKTGVSWLSLGVTSGIVAPGSTIDVPVTFDATEAIGGVYTGTIQVVNSSVNNPDVAIPVTLTVDGVKRLSVSPDTYDFGDVWQGATETFELTLSNSGDEATQITEISLDNGAFSHSAQFPLTVPAFGAVVVTVSYTASQIAVEAGLITITSDAEDNAELLVSLSGRGVLGAQISVDPESFNEMVLVGDELVRMLSITNNGDSEMDVSIEIENTVSVSATPKVWQGEQRWTNDIGAEFGNDLSTRLHTLQKYSTLAAVEFPFFDGFESGSFDQWNNDGGSYVREISSSVKQTGSFSLSQTGGSQSHNNGLSVDFNGGVAPEEVTFSVRSSSTQNNDGYVTFSNANNYIMFFFMRENGYLYANGIETVPYVANTWYDIRFVIDWDNNNFDYYVDDVLISENISFRESVAGIDQVNLYNHTSSQAWWDNINVGGEPPVSWLSTSVVDSRVAAGETIDIPVIFSAADMVGGVYSGIIHVLNNSGNNPDVSVPATLTVDGVKRLSVTPDTYDFGDVWQGATQTFELTLSNTGDEATVVTDISLDNVVFSSNAQLPLAIPAFGSAVVMVSYTASQLNVESGVMTIVSDAEDNPELTVSLTGTGVEAPMATLAPVSFELEMTTVDAPADLTSVLRNIGGADLDWKIASVSETSAPLQFKSMGASVVKPQFGLIYETTNYAHPFIAGEVIVALASGVTAFPAQLATSGVSNVLPLAQAVSPETGLTATKPHALFLVSLESQDSDAVIAKIEELKSNSDVIYAEPNYVRTLQGVPDDASFSSLYGMHNIGQSGGTVDADIDAVEAWDVHTGGKNVVLGLIDTGIDYLHPDLADNIWVNTAEQNGTPGVDDDGNGYVDDIYGYDFINNDGDPMDDHYHGTHCAGTIGGVGNNGVGVAGVAWNASMAALKIFNSSGATSDAAILNAVDYSNVMGMKITSNSWGGGPYSQSLYDLIQVGETLGHLFIAAAGNSSSNNDVSDSYPSGYDLDNIIAVAATDRNDGKASFSSYGATTVDLGAPGVDTYSCEPGGGYQNLSGTSMATPHVSGAALLLWTYNPSLSAMDVKNALLSTVDVVPSMTGVVLSNGRLNVNNALASIGPNWIAANPATPGVIVPGSAQDIITTIDPTGLLGGVYTGEVVVETNDPVTPLQTIQVTVTIDGFRSLVANPDALDFGGLEIGRSSELIVTLVNSSNEATEVSDLSIDNGHFTHTAQLPLTVPAFGEINVPVTFTPASVQSDVGTFTITSDAEDNAVITVPVSGSGLLGARIAVSPLSITEHVLFGEQATAEVVITNSGDANLELLLVSSDNTAVQGLSNEPYSFEHYLAFDKQSIDTRVGRPVLNDSGGPDTFGYSWRDSDEIGGPAFTWNSISSTGSVLSNVSGCDDCYQEQGLSFEFPFYGNDFNSVFVSSNGFLTFGTGSAQISNYALPSVSAPSNLIDLFHDDLDPRGAGTIYFQDFGTHAIVEFNDVDPYSGSGSYTFQAVLYANGKVVLYYNDLVGTTTGNTVGIQNGTKDDGLTVAYNTSYLKNQLAVELSAGAQWLTLNTSEAVVLPGESVTVEVLLGAADLVGGVYLGTIEVSHNDASVIGPVEVPVELHVFEAGRDTVSRITSVGVAGEAKMAGNRYSLYGITIGSAVSGILKGARHQVVFE